MHNELSKVFNYGQKEVRTVIKDGEPWFVAKDVCEILEITKYRDAVSRLSEIMRGSVVVDTLGGNQVMSIVSEAGVYKLVFTSRKPEAEKFVDWIAVEVLPSIRKHGMYATPQKMEELLLSPDMMIATLQALKSERDARIEAELLVVELIPKATAYDRIVNSEGTITVGDLAKLISGVTQIPIGGGKLLGMLRERRVINLDNSPTQSSIKKGLMKVKLITYSDTKGREHTYSQTLITIKGVEHIITMLLGLRVSDAKQVCSLIV